MSGPVRGPVRGPASTVPGLTPVLTSPILAALVPHAVMLLFVLSGSLDLAAFALALFIEAFLYSLLTGGDGANSRTSSGGLAIRAIPLLFAAVLWTRTEWNVATVLSVLGIVGTAVVTLALRCRRTGRVAGVVRRGELALRLGSAALALLLYAGARDFTRLTAAGWTPEDADTWSWLGARMMQFGETLGFSPEVTLTATLVLFLGVVELLWLSVRGAPAPIAD